MDTAQTVTQKATKSIKWSAMTEVMARALNPFVMVILARLLTPEDFGVVGATALVIGFSQVLWDMGLGKALVQTKEPVEKVANIVFWINAALGILMYVVIAESASWIAEFFESPASGPVLVVLGLQVIILSLTSVQQALFVRDLNFRQIFWAKLALSAVPGCFSIPLAIFGYGVWALVAGILAGSVMNSLILWTKSYWRPSISFDTEVAWRIFRFAIWVVAESFAAWLMFMGDQVIVGKFLNIESLGLYRTGVNVVAMLFGFVLSPFLPVLYPTFSRLQDDKPRLKEVFNQVNRIVIFLALPIGVGLYMTGPNIAKVVFGDKWEGLGYVLAFVGLSASLSWIISLNGEVYRAIGRPDINTKLTSIQLCVQMPAYFIVVRCGLEAFVWTRLAVTAVFLLWHVFVCSHVLGLSRFYLWKQGKWIVLGVCAMYIALLPMRMDLWGLTSHIDSKAGVLAIMIITGVVIYSSMLLMFSRSLLLEIRHVVLRAVSR